MSYLQQLADQLMTVPISTLELMYNEAVTKCDSDDLNEVAKYARIAGLIDQAATKRWHRIELIDNEFKFVPDAK